MRINWFSYIRVKGTFFGFLTHHYFPSILPSFIGVDVLFTFLRLDYVTFGLMRYPLTLALITRFMMTLLPDRTTTCVDGSLSVLWHFGL